MQFSKKITSKRCSHDSHILCINGERGRVWFEAVLCSTCSLHVHTLIRNHTVDWCYGTVLMIHHIWVYTDKAWELGIWTSKHQIATWQSSLTSVEFRVCFLVFWLIYLYCILWKFDLKWISKANKTNNTSAFPSSWRRLLLIEELKLSLQLTTCMANFILHTSVSNFYISW